MAGIRLGFAGTPEFAAIILRGLVAAGRRPNVVVCQPDRPRGRGRHVTACVVKSTAVEAGLPVFQPVTLKDPAAAAVLGAYALDVLIVAAYGLILPPAVLGLPRYGCLNVHASLLPRWRGAAPVERALMAGDDRTGVSIMQMDAGLDTGGVVDRAVVPIGPATTAARLEQTLAHLGTGLLLELWPRLDRLDATPQPAQGVSYAPKLTSADAVIRWSEPAVVIDRQVRALADRLPPFGHLPDHNGATDARNRIRVLASAPTPHTPAAAPGTIVGIGDDGVLVSCGVGGLHITRLQLTRGKGQPMSARDAVNGYPRWIRIGAVFASAAP